MTAGSRRWIRIAEHRAGPLANACDPPPPDNASARDRAGGNRSAPIGRCSESAELQRKPQREVHGPQAVHSGRLGFGECYSAGRTPSTRFSTQCTQLLEPAKVLGRVAAEPGQDAEELRPTGAQHADLPRIEHPRREKDLDARGCLVVQQLEVDPIAHVAWYAIGERETVELGPELFQHEGRNSTPKSITKGRSAWRIRTGFAPICMPHLRATRNARRRKRAKRMVVNEL
jgi:hypothetical protein